jgi:hypothetical protein
MFTGEQCPVMLFVDLDYVCSVSAFALHFGFGFFPSKDQVYKHLARIFTTIYLF